MGKPLRLLLVEDDPRSEEMVATVLEREGYSQKIKRVETPEDLQLCLAGNPWDVVLLDYHLPQMEALAALSVIRRLAPDTPCIVFSGSLGEEAVVDVLKLGAADYVAKDRPSRLVPAIERAMREVEERRSHRESEEARRKAEEEVRKRAEEWERTFDAITDLVSVHDKDFRILRVNKAFETALKEKPEQFVGRFCHEVVHPQEEPFCTCPMRDAFVSRKTVVREFLEPRLGIFLEVTASPILDEHGDVSGIIHVAKDIRARKQAEEEERVIKSQLLQSQKIESIGLLAAGIAHEINTPTQYIGDHCRFIKDGLQDLEPMFLKYDELLAGAVAGTMPPGLPAEVTAAKKEADVDYFRERAPKAIEQALEGVNRVATIVRAMKDFSHPGSAEKVPTNLNRAIESTTIVCRNEWKYVADLDLDLDEALPLVLCLPDELNQVILNLVVNAAHAIGDIVAKDPSQKGKIKVSTRGDGDAVLISIADTGSGIREENRGRVFDQFFTTKEVGKGTGQGLAMAYGVVVKKHGGTITFDTEVGKGTTFHIRLPVGARSEDA